MSRTRVNLRLALLTLLVLFLIKFRVAITGWSQTLSSIIENELSKLPVVARLLRLSPRLPAFRREYLRCSDGEDVVLLWPNPAPVTDSNQLWLILPGGMRPGNAFYTRDCLVSGLFRGSHWCAFQNPGILNQVKSRPPAGLTETTYVFETILYLKSRGYRVSLIGFSAGSMLAIQMARHADEYDKGQLSARPMVLTATTCEVCGNSSSSNALTSSSEPNNNPQITNTNRHHEGAEIEMQVINPGMNSGRLLECVVAVHGPDKIRWVFEHHRSKLLRMDVWFALSLHKTLIRSKSHVLPQIRWLSGVHFPWTTGWAYMQSVTESTFVRTWDEMEDEYWSCHKSMQTPFVTPVMRIISKNDPIVPFDSCVDPALFGNLDRVIVEPSGGHCAAFRTNPGLADVVRKWMTEQLAGQ